MKRGRNLWVWLTMLLGVCLATGTTNAAMVFEEDFDSYPEGEFPTAGDTWVNVDDGDFSITDAHAISGKSVKFQGWSYRLMHEFPRQTSGVVTATVHVRPGDNRYRSLTVSLADNWDDARATYVTFQDDGNIKYYPGGGGWTTVDSYNSYTWVKLTLEVDLDAKTYNIYTDDVLRVSDAGFNDDGVTGIDQIYLDNRGPALSWADEITITPEPTTLALLAMGGVGILIRKK